MVWVLILHFEQISGDLDINASASILYNNIIEMIYNLFTRCNKNHFRSKFLLSSLLVKNLIFKKNIQWLNFDVFFCDRYLQVEWDTKKKTPFNLKEKIRGSTATKVPQQTNFSDCGVYILQYVESFFEVRSLLGLGFVNEF